MGFLLTYQDLILLPTFEERFNYLQKCGTPSEVASIAAMKLYSGAEED